MATGRPFGKLAASPSVPEVAAGVIRQAVGGTGERLRSRAGPGAHALIDDRKAQDDATFYGRLRASMET